MREVDSNSSMGGLTLLQILFIGLKLTGHVTWSWWWVMSPTTIPTACLAIFLAGLGVCWLLLHFWGTKK